MTFETRVDCPSCRVEGARIESWAMDAMDWRAAVPLSVRCRLCGFEGEGSAGGVVERRAGQTFRSREELERALDGWAVLEGLKDAADLMDVYFVERSSAAIWEAHARGEGVETTFDVADFLFSGGGGVGGGDVATVVRDLPPLSERIPSTVPSRRCGGPRDELLALASVASADGEASPDDRAILARAAAKRGVPPLEPHELRVWRPGELLPPPMLEDRERVLEEMLQVAWADGQIDESELLVVREFARAWGIDPERVKEWVELYSFGNDNRFERWFRRLGLFLFPAK